MVDPMTIMASGVLTAEMLSSGESRMSGSRRRKRKQVSETTTETMEGESSLRRSSRKLHEPLMSSTPCVQQNRSNTVMDAVA